MHFQIIPLRTYDIDSDGFALNIDGNTVMSGSLNDIFLEVKERMASGIKRLDY